MLRLCVTKSRAAEVTVQDLRVGHSDLGDLAGESTIGQAGASLTT